MKQDEVFMLIRRETGQAVNADTPLDALEIDSLSFIQLTLDLADAAGKPLLYEDVAKMQTMGELAEALA